MEIIGKKIMLPWNKLLNQGFRTESLKQTDWTDSQKSIKTNWNGTLMTGMYRKFNSQTISHNIIKIFTMLNPVKPDI